MILVDIQSVFEYTLSMENKLNIETLLDQYVSQAQAAWLGGILKRGAPYSRQYVGKIIRTRKNEMSVVKDGGKTKILLRSLLDLPELPIGRKPKAEVEVGTDTSQPV